VFYSLSLFLQVICYRLDISIDFYFCLQIPLPPVDEKKKVVEDVDKDRRYAIDASIVRIMKSRKVLGHQTLVMECVEQLGRMFKVWNILQVLLAVLMANVVVSV
jgi:hypothetical protein